MDRKHRLEAPHDEELRTIEQINPHEELSALYRNPKNSWDGELVSVEEREERREKKDRAISSTITRQFIAVGIFGISPLVLLALLVTAIVVTVEQVASAYIVFPAMIGFLLWVMFALHLLQAYRNIFYDHALSSTVFLFFQTVITGLGSYSFLTLMVMRFDIGIFPSALLISGFSLIWSALASFVLLHIWVNRFIGASAKLALILLLAALAAVGAWLPFLV